MSETFNTCKLVTSCKAFVQFHYYNSFSHQHPSKHFYIQDTFLIQKLHIPFIHKYNYADIWESFLFLLLFAETLASFSFAFFLLLKCILFSSIYFLNLYRSLCLCYMDSNFIYFLFFYFKIHLLIFVIWDHHMHVMPL